MNKKYRVACTKNLGQVDHPAVEYMNAESLADAVRTLRKLAKDGLYQSEQYPIKGLANIAAIEVWDEAEQDWLFWIEE